MDKKSTKKPIKTQKNSYIQSKENKVHIYSQLKFCILDPKSTPKNARKMKTAKNDQKSIKTQKKSYVQPIKNKIYIPARLNFAFSKNHQKPGKILTSFFDSKN